VEVEVKFVCLDSLSWNQMDTDSAKWHSLTRRYAQGGTFLYHLTGSQLLRHTLNFLSHCDENLTCIGPKISCFQKLICLKLIDINTSFVLFGCFTTLCRSMIFCITWKAVDILIKPISRDVRARRWMCADYLSHRYSWKTDGNHEDTWQAYTRQCPVDSPAW
jgi:hypothetical protein